MNVASVVENLTSYRIIYLKLLFAKIFSFALNVLWKDNGGRETESGSRQLFGEISRAKVTDEG